jgi:hypothetical protein
LSAALFGYAFCQHARGESPGLKDYAAPGSQGSSVEQNLWYLRGFSRTGWRLQNEASVLAYRIDYFFVEIIDWKSFVHDDFLEINCAAPRGEDSRPTVQESEAPRNTLAKICAIVLSARMNRIRWVLLFALPALPGVGLQAAETAMTPDQIGQVVRMESITIPMPGEFFAAINKQGRPNWKQLVRTGTPEATDSRSQIALILGTLVADGYIAVEAQDSQGVKNIGKEIINLAKKLNVSQSVLGRGNSINDFAENNDWNALREELEATQNEVKLDMFEQKDSSLVTLVTLGAWVRGTELASGLIEGSYTPEAARLLRQPAIIGYLLERIGALPLAMQEDPLVARLRTALAKSHDFVTAETPSAENVKDLHQTMHSIVTAIGTGT